MATINVTSTADSGAGTLRQAITDLNLIAGSHTITFTGLTGTITLASALPTLTKSMTITGPGLSSLTISGNNLYRVFLISGSLTLFISGLTISNGRATGTYPATIGGGIYTTGSTLTVSNCTFNGCYATGAGGAIYSEYGQFSVTNCTFASNTSLSGGGGIWASGSTATVGNCTFSGNTGTAYSGTSSFTIYNCTFNGNTGIKAGAISTGGASSAILSSTISGNTATDTSGVHPAGGGIYHSEYCSLTIKNSIISGNTGTYADVGGYNNASIPVAKVANIVGSAYNWSGDVSAASLGTLSSLANNGGTTLTMAIPAGSSAIGAGNATASNTSPVSALDQRGTARSATTPTIGAYEYTGSSPPTVSSISPSTGTALGGTSVTITGANLTGATGVTIGGVAATSVSIVNSTTITATTPVGSVGTASVLVTTSIGTNSANTLFTYFIPPNTVRIKRSSTASVTPTILLEGELAANISDLKLWIGNSSKSPVLISDYKAMGTVTSVAMTVPTGLTVTGSPVTTAGTLGVSLTAGYSIPTTASQTNWDSGYTQRLQWDGGATNLVAATGRTSLSLGNVENTALSTWAGSTNITTVGAVTTRTLAVTPVASTGTQSPSVTVTAPSHTALTASTESSDLNINLARTVQFATGALTTQRAVIISAPTYSAVAASTITTAVTLSIEGPPNAGSNVTITNPVALNVGTSNGIGIIISGVQNQSNDLFRANVTGVDSTTFISTTRPALTIASSGALVLNPTNSSAGSTNQLRFLELAANGTNYVGFKASDSIASNVIWTLPAADGTAGQVLSTNASGVLSWATPSSGGSGATLNAVSAATATQAGIANANFGIRWNWARTTDTTSALELGETTAATTGTSTSGIPNQVGLKLSTLAASTMSPLSVYSRGSHVFSVSPTATQILAASGTASVPAYSFAGSTNTGLSLTNTDRLVMTAAGTSVAYFHPLSLSFYVDGTAAWPAIQANNTTCGIFFASGAVGISTNPAGTPTENARFSGSGILQTSRGSADAISYAINSRKARGTVESPTVITTGDDLLTMSGYGYVGATNTYLEASRITFDSIGTISDTSTGIGGTIDFLTRDVGGAVTSKFTMTNKGELLVAGAAGTTGQVLTSAGSGIAPSWASVTAGSSVTTSATAPATPTAGNQWYDTTTGIIYTYVNDGTSSQWVQGSTATLATGVPAGGTTNQFLVKSSATDYATAWTGTLTNPTFTNYTETMFEVAGSGTWSINLSQGTIQKFYYNGNFTLILPASVAGKSFVIIVQHQAYGLSTTWSSSSPLKWVGGTTPTGTGVSGKIDIYSFFQDGTNTYGTVYGLNF